MSDITQRLKMILSYYQLNSADFSNKVGVQKSSISHLLSGRNKPSFDFINKLAVAFDEINIEWFVTGKGEMLKESSSNDANSDKDGSKIIKHASNIQHNDDDAHLKHENENIKNHNSQKLDDNSPINNDVNSVLLIYNDDTFKVLKQR
jgi:transcriptional regulator with XRE-family HTH domain